MRKAYEEGRHVVLVVAERGEVPDGFMVGADSCGGGGSRRRPRPW